MRYFRKPLRIFFLFLAVPVLLAIAALLMQDRVTGLVIGELNRNLEVKIATGTVRLSFLRKFPQVSVQMKDVVVFSSPGFTSADETPDTLLSSGSILLVLNPVDLLKGNYSIESAVITKGFIRLLTDQRGNINYRLVAEDQDNSGSESFSLDLKKVLLREIRTVYSDLYDSTGIYGFIREGRLRSRISGEEIVFSATGTTLIDSLIFPGFSIVRPLDASIDITLNSSDTETRFSRSTLKVEGYEFSIEGAITNDNVADLVIDGKDLDLSGILKYLPEKYGAKAAGYSPSGLLNAKCRVRGSFSGKRTPIIEAEFGLTGGSVSYRKDGPGITGINLVGMFSNSRQDNPASSVFRLNEMAFTLGASEFKGSLEIKGFRNPVTTISLAGRLDPSEIKMFFGLDKIIAAEGTVDFDLRLSTASWPFKQLTRHELGLLEPAGTLSFRSFSLGLAGGFFIKSVSGEVNLEETYNTPGLKMEYKGQKILVAGEFKNLGKWLAGIPVIMNANADVSFGKFLPDVIFPPMPESAGAEQGFKFPGDIIADIRFSADSLRYRSLKASDVSAELAYRPGTLKFRNLKMNSLKGTISGDGFIVQNTGGSIISRGDLEFRVIDVNNAFTAFRNFGQDFIVAENLSGSLSGEVSMLLPMDRSFNTKVNAITADGSFSLENGALKNFEPVKALSRFIEVSELENINFEKMENDFFIRNNTLFLPRMDVRSSAADLTVNGQHSFTNEYEYHVKMLLSQLLSKKRKATARPVTEFGAVKDDGLGRTSILLKVESRGDDVKIGYDLKAAGREVKNSMAKEKQSLKTILNEEYGWYDDEKKVNAPEEKKKPKVSIIFEETDSIPAASGTNETSRPKGLFRKK